MKPLQSIILTSYGHFIVGFSLLLITGQLFVTLWAFSQRRTKNSCCMQTLMLVLDFILVLFLFYGVFETRWHRADQYIAPAKWFFSLPGAVVFGLECLLLLAAVLFFQDNKRYEKGHPTRAAIKQALDLMPVAVCFGDGNGRIALMNLGMQTLCRALTGWGSTDIQTLWKAVTEKGTEQNGRYLVENGQTYLFAISMVQAGDRRFEQVTATDVTSQYRTTLQLQEQNRRLRELQRRMRAYSAEAADLAMDQEILAARVAVHDEMGHVLLQGRYYLEHPEAVDGAGLLTLLRQTNETLLYEAEQPDDTVTDLVQAALRMAQHIGVNVEMTGTCPEDEACRGILAQAIRECAANTVKHADGSRLDVTFEEDPFDRIFTIQSDGAVPKTPIRPKGGLLSLQHAAEAVGGTLEIRSAPVFTIQIRLPKEVEP